MVFSHNKFSIRLIVIMTVQLFVTSSWQLSVMLNDTKIPLRPTPRLRQCERQCADTIGTVLVPWAGHFQC